jgi:nucleotide-binding universal stress UspA family protein
VSLIVLGHRGRGLLSKLLGSTTLNVIKSTDKPVLVVKTEQKDVFRKVLFCYHPLIFNEDIKGCIERLPFKEMVLLRVVEPLLPPEAKGEEMKNQVKSAEEFLNDVKSKLEKDVDVIVKIGDPAKVILETAENINATCIALSTRAKRPILGVTTDYILKNSKISVLVFKEFLKRNDFIQSA